MMGVFAVQNTGLPAIRGLGNMTVAPPEEKSTAASSSKYFDDNGDLLLRSASVIVAQIGSNQLISD